MNEEEVYVVTGATGGIGKAITEALVRQGCRVIMACRNAEVANRFCCGIAEWGLGKPEVMTIDLGSLASVARFAAVVRERGLRVKALVHNAGVLNKTFIQTVDGLEEMTQVNYVAPWLLTRLLLPLMAIEARIIYTSSCTWRLGRMKEDFLTPDPKHFSMFRTYGRSKRALLMFTAELAARCDSSQVIVNAVDPGVVNTGMITMHRWFDPLTDLFFRPFIKNVYEGAKTSVFLTCSEEVIGITGGFWRDCHYRKMPDAMTREEERFHLWDTTEQLVKKYLER